jgi:DNA-binding SARP family transcriptional activator
MSSGYGGAVTRPDVTFTVLGPLAAEHAAAGPVPLRGSRQRAILARLLIARGRVVPVDRLAGDLWAEPPDGAVAAIRTFVADLRRALEPGRPPRQPARLLVTAPPGYTLRTTPEAVDAGRFEAAVAGAGRLIAAGDGAAALARTEEALGLWRGPAYAEFEAEHWARAEIDRLDELRMLAVERRAEALLLLGRAADAASDLGAHTAAHPLREEAWRLLATALYRAGRQGDALAALRRARETLVGELGLDPGPALRQLEGDILAQAPRLSEPVAVPPPTSFFGRADELATLAAAAEDVARRREPGLALISGEAGAGKTALAGELTRRLSGAGWTVAWGRSPEYDGAPTAWPIRPPPVTGCTGGPPAASPRSVGGGRSSSSSTTCTRPTRGRWTYSPPCSLGRSRQPARYSSPAPTGRRPSPPPSPRRSPASPASSRSGCTSWACPRPRPASSPAPPPGATSTRARYASSTTAAAATRSSSGSWPGCCPPIPTRYPPAYAT